LHVNDPVSKFIDGIPKGNEITIHQILTHTSGIPDINGMPEYDTMSFFPQTPTSLMAVIRTKPLDFEPEAKFEYSN